MWWMKWYNSVPKMWIHCYWTVKKMIKWCTNYILLQHTCRCSLLAVSYVCQFAVYCGLGTSFLIGEWPIQVLLMTLSTIQDTTLQLLAQLLCRFKQRSCLKILHKYQNKLCQNKQINISKITILIIHIQITVDYK